MSTVIIDLTGADDPPKIARCDTDDKCPICWEDVRDGGVYFAPPCGHVHCRQCMRDNRLNQCARCTQHFIVAEQVLVNIANTAYDLTN